jgi:hypothetical protein
MAAPHFDYVSTYPTQYRLFVAPRNMTLDELGNLLASQGQQMVSKNELMSLNGITDPNEIIKSGFGYVVPGKSEYSSPAGGASGGIVNTSANSPLVVKVTSKPLTFWQRYGKLAMIFGGAVALLMILDRG